MAQKQMYRIEFAQNSSTIRIADGLPMEDAVQFGLNLHRSSNQEHKIYVMHDDIIDVVFQCEHEQK